MTSSPVVMRKTTEADLPDVMAIIGLARQTMSELGFTQWSEGYPSEELIASDIARGVSYVLVDHDNRVLATQVVSFDEEPAYDTIERGQWNYPGAYATVHRVAVHPEQRGRGLAKLLLAEAERVARDAQVAVMRADTHEANQPMRRVLDHAGFRQCGHITLGSRGSRVAYEKALQ